MPSRSHGCSKPGYAQVRDGESGETRFGLGAAARRALVADLAARAGRRPGIRRNRGRVVVRLDFHQDVRELVADSVLPFRARIPARDLRPFDHR